MPDRTSPARPSATDIAGPRPPRRLRWLPAGIGGSVRVLAWLSFLAETIIIGTGGAVRLTASGLGCSEWPLCTPDSLVPTAEQGIHGIIEFGNRTMTGVVGLVAILLLLLTLHAVGGSRPLFTALRYMLAGIVIAVVTYAAASPFSGSPFTVASAALLLTCIVAAVHSVRSTPERRDLTIPAWLVVIGVVAQAFVGGITVLTGLNPFIVGFHYTASLLLVCISAIFLVRMGATPGPRERAVPLWFAMLSHLTGLALAVTIVFGVLTTGSGPHSGDANVIRDGFDATVLAHVHSWPGYILAAFVVVLTVTAWVLALPPRRWLLVLTGAIVVQVAVGIWQAREGLPEILVGIHMVLAALSAATYAVVVLHLKRPARQEPIAQDLPAA